MTISIERMEKALTYLAETDEPCAHLKSDTERAEFRAKAMRDAIFMREDGTVAERSAKAGTHAEYCAFMDVYFITLGKYEAMRNKRGTEAIVIEAWRSINSSRNKGNL